MLIVKIFLPNFPYCFGYLQYNTMDAYLHEIWYNPKYGVSYLGPEKFYNYLKKHGKYKPTLKVLKQWLQDQHTYSISKPFHRKFKKSKIIGSDYF